MQYQHLFFILFVDLRKIFATIYTRNTGPIFYAQWKKFGRELQIDEVHLLTYASEMRLGQIDVEEIVLSILRRWKLQRASDATITMLTSALEKIGLQDSIGKFTFKYICILSNCKRSLQI